MSVANIQLKKRIMRRVYIISVMRRVFHPVVLKGVILVIFVVVGNILVSVPNVINNMLLASDTKINFLLEAFSQTETLVQMISLGSIFLITWLIKDALQSFSFFGHHNDRQLVV